jgi:hypothetical protein
MLEHEENNAETRGGTGKQNQTEQNVDGCA